MKTKLLTLTIAVALGWFAFALSGFAAFEILGDDICSVVSEYSCFEAEIERARRGELAQSNSTLVNPRKNLSPIKEKYSTQISLTKDTDGNAHVAAVALVSDDGCDVRINGTQWLKEGGKGHDISKGLRRYGKLLLPGDENRFDIEYSQTFYDPAVLENDLDGLTMVVMPIPIDISVKDSSGKMNDRILVKKGETIEVAIHPVFWEHDLPGNDKIEWELERVDSTGKFSPSPITATGTNVSVTIKESGIYRICAIINGGRYYYRRHEDVPHHNGMFGLRAGDFDYVGVYTYETQRKIVGRAFSYCREASTKFAYGKDFDFAEYGYSNFLLKKRLANANKCNIFVFAVAYEERILIHLKDREFTVAGMPTGLEFYKSPPTVKEWMDSSEKIETTPAPNWAWLKVEATTLPEPGHVVMDDAHMGILDYDGSWISAGPSNVNKKACIYGCGYIPYGASILRERKSDK